MSAATVHAEMARLQARLRERAEDLVDELDRLRRTLAAPELDVYGLTNRMASIADQSRLAMMTCCRIDTLRDVLHAVAASKAGATE